LQDWDRVREVPVYPANTGVLAAYSRTELYAVLDFAVRAHGQVEEELLGPVFRNSSLQLCLTQFRQVSQSVLRSAGESTALCLTRFR
jgi:hypothetical protein